MYKIVLNQLNPSSQSHVETCLEVYHTHTHTQDTHTRSSRDPALLSTSEPLCNQASQAETFWKRGRPTLVGEMGSGRGFQVTSWGPGAGGPRWGCVHLCMHYRQKILQWLTYEVISGWTTGGYHLLKTAVFVWVLHSLCVCGIIPSPPKASFAHSLFFLPCYPDTLNSPGSRVSSKALTPSRRNALAGCWHTHTHAHTSRKRHTRVHTHARKHKWMKTNTCMHIHTTAWISGRSRCFQNTYWNYSHQGHITEKRVTLMWKATTKELV